MATASAIADARRTNTMLRRELCMAIQHPPKFAASGIQTPQLDQGRRLIVGVRTECLCVTRDCSTITSESRHELSASRITTTVLYRRQRRACGRASALQRSRSLSRPLPRRRHPDVSGRGVSRRETTREVINLPSNLSVHGFENDEVAPIRIANY
jgi:hypothetical protein